MVGTRTPLFQYSPSNNRIIHSRHKNQSYTTLLAPSEEMYSRKTTSALGLPVIRQTCASTMTLSRIASVCSYSVHQQRSCKYAVYFPSAAMHQTKSISNRSPRTPRSTPSGFRWMSTRFTRENSEADYAKDLLSDEFHCRYYTFYHAPLCYIFPF